MESSANVIKSVENMAKEGYIAGFSQRTVPVHEYYTMYLDIG